VLANRVLRYFVRVLIFFLVVDSEPATIKNRLRPFASGLASHAKCFGAIFFSTNSALRPLPSALCPLPFPLLTSLPQTQKTIQGRGRSSIYVKPFTLEQATENRDSMAKEVYSRLFDFIVMLINQKLSGDLSPNFISVLDIYGFEEFDVNWYVFPPPLVLPSHLSSSFLLAFLAILPLSPIYPSFLSFSFFFLSLLS
jgi:hypothetical protein